MAKPLHPLAYTPKQVAAQAEMLKNRLKKNQQRFKRRFARQGIEVYRVYDQDTGLFADLRKSRAWVRDRAAGKRVLNLFAYTGSFNCYAAQGGALETVAVDQSGLYLDWAKENLLLNGFSLDRHRRLRQEVFHYLRTARQQAERFDLIVVDPPSSSTLGSPDGFEVARDHGALIEACLRILKPGGEILFSTHLGDFEPDPRFAWVLMRDALWPEDFRQPPHSFLLKKER